MRTNYRHFLFLLVVVLVIACQPISPDIDIKPTATTTVVIVNPERIPFPSPEPTVTFPSMDTSNQNITYNSRPDFIDWIKPPEYAIYPLSLYDVQLPSGVRTIPPPSSVYVVPNLEVLMEPGDDFSDRNIRTVIERMELSINDERIGIPNGSYGGLVSIGPTGNEWVDGIQYYWTIPLSIGQYKAEFRFHQTSGNIQEYIWHFEIGEG